MKLCSQAMIVILIGVYPSCFNSFADELDKNRFKGNFIDGTFEEEAKLRKQFELLMESADNKSMPTSKDPFMKSITALSMQSLSWDHSGIVKLVNEKDNTLIELTQADKENSSIAQIVNFNNRDISIEFDMKVLEGDTGTFQLSISQTPGGPAWGGPREKHILAAIDLSTVAKNKKHSFDLSEHEYFVSQSKFVTPYGYVSFGFVDGTKPGTRVRLDNIKVIYLNK